MLQLYIRTEIKNVIIFIKNYIYEFQYTLKHAKRNTSNQINLFAALHPFYILHGTCSYQGSCTMPQDRSLLRDT